MKEERFLEMIRRLRREALPQEGLVYIADEQEFKEEMDRLENGSYKEAYKKAFKEAFKEAYKEGRKEGIEKIALNMLNNGMPPEDIAKLTELSLDQIKAL